MAGAYEMCALERARANGRGVSVFRPEEAAAFLGVNREVIDDAMRRHLASRGRLGLAFFRAGKGSLITRESLQRWMEQQERAVLL